MLLQLHPSTLHVSLPPQHLLPRQKNHNFLKNHLLIWKKNPLSRKQILPPLMTAGTLSLSLAGEHLLFSKTSLSLTKSLLLQRLQLLLHLRPRSSLLNRQHTKKLAMAKLLCANFSMPSSLLKK